MMHILLEEILHALITLRQLRNHGRSLLEFRRRQHPILLRAAFRRHPSVRSPFVKQALKHPRFFQKIFEKPPGCYRISMQSP